ncbi:unnamed protein product, partial [Mycena citricolor]
AMKVFRSRLQNCLGRAVLDAQRKVRCTVGYLDLLCSSHHLVIRQYILLETVDDQMQHQRDAILRGDNGPAVLVREVARVFYLSTLGDHSRSHRTRLESVKLARQIKDGIFHITLRHR